MPPLLRKCLLVLAAGAAALLSGEAGHRLWRFAAGRPYDAEQVAAEIRRLADPLGAFVPTAAPAPGNAALAPGAAAQAGDARRAALAELRRPILHPYCGSEGAHDTGGVLAAFRAGIGADEFVLLVMGGSVASAFAEANRGRLEAALAGHPRLAGRKPRVLNYAHPSYKQPQQLMRLGYLFSLGYRPHAVLELDGFNEVALSLQNLAAGIHPVYPPPPVWSELVRGSSNLGGGEFERLGRLYALSTEARQLAERALGSGLLRSSVLGSAALERLRDLDRERTQWTKQSAGVGADDPLTHPERARLRRQMGGPDFDREQQAVLEAGARNWLESSCSMEALCRVRDVRYLHVLQPTLHDSGAKPLAPEERALGAIPLGWEPGARLGYPLLRALAPELEARGVRFYDASRLFEEVSEALYVDHCHLGDRGNQLLGDAVAAALLAAL
jgi:hypothetical protein